MDGTMRMPLARDEGLVLEELADELLVYDLDVDYAHCLGVQATRVWRRCDGATPASEVARELGFDNGDVARALEELARCELLAPSAGNGNGAGSGYTRRDFGVRVTKVGAVAASVPLIVSIMAPTAAHAQTPCASLPFIGSCGVCNQGGRPTPCCCCHGGPGVDSNAPTGCRDDAKACCCSGPGTMSGAHHCTEGKGNPVNCSTITC